MKITVYNILPTSCTLAMDVSPRVCRVTPDGVDVFKNRFEYQFSRAEFAATLRLARKQGFVIRRLG